ncbi:MAG: hypothetical protein RL367_1209 [Pseudomonadota bacterium]
MSAKLKIAVVGAGTIGRRHVTYLDASKSAELSAVVDPTEAAKAFALTAGVPWFADLDTLLATQRPDGLIVATPNPLHHSNARDAIKAGVPVLVEKPLADTIEAAEAIVAAAAASHVPVLTGHHRRHSATLQKAKTIIDEGIIGRVVAVHATCWFYKPDAYFDVTWRREAGSGPVLINLIHDVDNLRYLLGEVVAVQAVEANFIRGFAVEDSCVILLHFASGALGTMTVSDAIVAPWSWELTSGENCDYHQTSQNCYMIGGSHGSLALPSLEVWSNTGERSWNQPVEVERAGIDCGDPLARQIAHFCAVIQGNETPVCSASDGLGSLKVISAIKQAAASGTMVRLP